MYSPPERDPLDDICPRCRQLVDEDDDWTLFDGVLYHTKCLHEGECDEA